MTSSQIRTAADIVRESVSALDYGRQIGLPINRNGFTNCPFHPGDHTGSLKLYPGSRGIHCFGCGVSGDVIELAKRYFSLSFPEAVAKIGEDMGIKLPTTGMMTYDQKKAYQAARRKTQELKIQAAMEKKLEDKHFDALDAYLAAEDALEAISDREWAVCREEIAGITAEEWAATKTTKGFCGDTPNQSDRGFSPDLIEAISKRNAARMLAQNIEADWVGGYAL